MLRLETIYAEGRDAVNIFFTLMLLTIWPDFFFPSFLAEDSCFFDSSLIGLCYGLTFLQLNENNIVYFALFISAKIHTFFSL